MKLIDIKHGDSYELIKNIPDKSIDLIITDPPYRYDIVKGGTNSELGKRATKFNTELMDCNLSKSIDIQILYEFIRVMKTINIYIWCNKIQLPMYLNFFLENNCSFDILIWNKTNPPPLFHDKYLTDKEYCLYIRRGGYCNPENYNLAKTVFFQPINSKDKKLYGHPTIKPLNIIETLMKNSSHENEIVFDPFMGSGTTGVAAKRLKRNFIGIEIDNNYFNIAKNRIENESIQNELF